MRLVLNNIYRLHRSRLASPSLLWRHHRHHERFPAIPLQIYRRRRQYSFTKCSLSSNENGMSSQPLSITFMTDVEGDGAYFDRFVNHSKLLGFRSIPPSFGRYAINRANNNCDDDSIINGMKWNLGEWDEDYFPYDKEVVFIEDDGGGRSNKNSMLVYGGDVWDKGGADLYVMRQLLSLHRRYPDRAHFLMGNRDINKMRIVDELGICKNNAATDESLPNHEGVYWLRRTFCSGLPADPESNNVPSDSATERLKWMLQRTMGSVDAFELRRNELKRERVAIMNAASVSSSSRLEHTNSNSNDAMKVSDCEVAQSYIRSCCPVSGIMSQYLTHSSLAIRLGPVLFMHGALPILPSNSDDNQSLDFPTPWMHTNADCKSLSDWIGVLNDFASNQVKAWKEYHGFCLENSSRTSLDGVWATKGGYFNKTIGGTMFGALMQYGMGTLPDRSKTQSCVYNSWMHDGLPREDMFGSDESMRTLSELFTREGIQLILTGHQPVGDAPWPIQISTNGEKTKFLIIPCDTSFAGDTRWTSLEGFDSTDSASLGRGSISPSGRGEVAFSEPLIQLCPTARRVNSVNIHGCLSDGSYYETGNIMDVDGEVNLLLGRKLGNVEFKDNHSGDTREGVFWAKGKVGDNHLVTSGEGFQVWNAYIKYQD